jgi:hypothetical protein
MPQAAGDDSTHTVTSLPSTECHLAVSPMSHSDDCHRETDCTSTVLDLLSGGLRQLFLTDLPSESFDAFQDVIVDVCPNLVRATIVIQESLSRHRNLARQRAAAATAMHSMTAQTIPPPANFNPHSRTFSIASPRPPQTPATSFKPRYRKSAAT